MPSRSRALAKIQSISSQSTISSKLMYCTRRLGRLHPTSLTYISLRRSILPLSEQSLGMSTRPTRKAPKAPARSSPNAVYCHTCGRVICKPVLPLIHFQSTYTTLYTMNIQTILQLAFRINVSENSLHGITTNVPGCKKVIPPDLTSPKLHASPTALNRSLKNIVQTAADERSLVSVLLPTTILKGSSNDYWVMVGRGRL